MAAKEQKVDIFCRNDARNVLNRKTVLCIGDSNMRAMYKDMVQIIQANKMLLPGQLKRKNEDNFLGDKRLTDDVASNGKDFREERIYKEGDPGITIQYFYITRCYNDYVKSIISKVPRIKPDLILFNSCVWDISRYGSKGIDEYQKNLKALMADLRQTLSLDCLFIWLTTLPLSRQMKGGFLPKELADALAPTMRFDVVEANHFASHVVNSCDFDVLDLHYHLQWQIHRRADDGIHWTNEAVRHVTNLILTHVSKAWKIKLPGNFVPCVASVTFGQPEWTPALTPQLTENAAASSVFSPNFMGSQQQQQNLSFPNPNQHYPFSGQFHMPNPIGRGGSAGYNFLPFAKPDYRPQDSGFQFASTMATPPRFAQPQQHQVNYPGLMNQNFRPHSQNQNQGYGFTGSATFSAPNTIPVRASRPNKRRRGFPRRGIRGRGAKQFKSQDRYRPYHS